MPAIDAHVRLTACLKAIRAAIPMIKRQGGGSIVNTASISGLFADVGASPYNAAKGGFINFTRTAAAEAGVHGICVNCVCPRVIETALTAPVTESAAVREAAIAQIALRRLGKPEESPTWCCFWARTWRI
jgi:NAD(P)-dependent dehydrogenase (short-subunit alcohol dehydrogenase family)